MFYAKNTSILPLCVAVKYTQQVESENDYLDAPRPCHNLVFMLEGEGNIYTKTSVFTVKKGEIFIIPCGTVYKSAWKANPKTIFHSIHFNFSPQNDPLANTDIPIQKIRADNFEKLYDYVLQLQQCQYSHNELSFFGISVFYRLLGELLPLVEHTHEKPSDNPVAAAIEYLEYHYKEPCKVEDLAELCFLSPSRFFYRFKEQTGFSPIVYKNRVCIRHAAQTLLLEKHKSIEEISEEYGFESAVYFRRLFKRVTGKTPTTYRQEETLL